MSQFQYKSITYNYNTKFYKNFFIKLKNCSKNKLLIIT